MARSSLLLLLALLLPACGFDSTHLLERGNWTPQRHTVKELRDQHVIKQETDYSCGAAALATLMMFYFHDEVTEKEVLDLLQQKLTPEQKKDRAAKGFSLLELKQIAEVKGYQAAGFKIAIWQLAELLAPVIVFVEPFGYKHFAVYRGMDRGRVYLADPSRGNLRMSIGQFIDEWSGIVFVLGKAGEEEIKNYELQIPRPLFVQPELAQLNAALDLGMMTKNLPQR
jgi:predicted double-glycine peptidase